MGLLAVVHRPFRIWPQSNYVKLRAYDLDSVLLMRVVWYAHAVACFGLRYHLIAQ
jgi:hypothetical protein